MQQNVYKQNISLVWMAKQTFLILIIESLTVIMIPCSVSISITS